LQALRFVEKVVEVLSEVLRVVEICEDGIDEVALVAKLIK